MDHMKYGTTQNRLSKALYLTSFSEPSRQRGLPAFARSQYLAQTRTILLSQGHCQTETGGEKEAFAKYEQPGRPALTPYRLLPVSFH